MRGREKQAKVRRSLWLDRHSSKIRGPGHETRINGSAKASSRQPGKRDCEDDEEGRRGRVRMRGDGMRDGRRRYGSC